MSASSDYTAADSLQVLEGLDAVRKRPGMYIGTTDSRGLHHCLWEIVDNSVDEAIAGHCTAITVTLCPDGSVEVTDDGRGIPVDVEPSSGLSGVELVFTKLHAGGKFGGGGYAVSGGLHGVGASVVNALSTRLDVEVTRDESVYSMGFSAGVSGAFDSSGTFTPAPGAPPVKIGSAPTGASGTLVRWWPDRNLFTPDAALDFDEVVSRLRQTAFLVPQVTFTLTDARESEPVVETLHFAGGLVDFVNWMVTAEGHKLVSDVLHLVGSGTFTERIPVINGGKTSIEDVERNVDVDVSLAWTSGYEAHVKSFVNIISTPHGGTHLAGFERGVTKATTAALRATKGIKYPDDGVVKDDVLEGVTAAVTVRLAEPQFEGQTKEVLGTKDVAGIVNTVVTESLEKFFTTRGTKDQARRVLEKVAAAARARIAAREVKETRRRKSALESSSMPAKLVDCRSEDVSRAELFIVEGDSALGTFKQGRDSDFQAALPIRGKILNTLRATEKQMLANNECAAIIQVMGAGSGRSFELPSVRYGKLVLLSVAGDTPTLYRDHVSGQVRYGHIGDMVDEWLAHEEEIPLVSVPAISKRTGEIAWCPLTGMVRHPFTGRMVNITTESGRSLEVTAGHSIYLWDDVTGFYTKPADEIAVGEQCVIPTSLDLAVTTQTHVDLVRLLSKSPLGSGIRVSGAGASRVSAARLVKSFPASQGIDEPRVELSLEVWRELAVARSREGVSMATAATALGFKQAATVQDYERARSRPTEAIFRKYLALIGHPWPESAIVVPSKLAVWAEDSGSKHAKFKQSSSVVWLDSLTEEEIELLGDDVVLHVRNFADVYLPRQLPLDESFALLAGWFTAEGSFDGRGRISLALGASDEGYIPELLEAIDTVADKPAVQRRDNRPGFEQLRLIHLHHGLLSRVMKALGMGTTAHFKSVPQPLFNASDSVKLAFLRGLYLGDGRKRSTRNVGFYSMSEDLTSGVHILLTSLGCTPQVSTTRAVNTTSGRHYGDQKIVQVKEPSQVESIRAVWRGSDQEHLRELRTNQDRTFTTSKPVSENSATDKVISVKFRDVEGLPVYDFTVDEHHTFLAGHRGLLALLNTDADVDGAHIRCLLLTLVFRYMRPLLDAGMVYAAVPPLHQVTVGSGKRAKHHYTYSDEQLRTLLDELRRKKVTLAQDAIQRYKGLGEMDAEQLATTTLAPGHRRLRRITVEDAEATTRMFDVTMGSDVSIRRDFIVNNAAELDETLIDT